MAINSAVGSFDASQTIMSDIQPVIDYMVGEQTKTNEYNSAEAAIQRQFQATQSALEREFNASEAAKNRDWQEMMSNTAHQREVADLRAAGLNPVLSASGGNGAAVGSGATASQSSSPSGAKGSAGNINAGLVSLFGTLLDNQTKLMMSMNSGAQVNSYYDTQLALAELRRAWEVEDRAYEEDWYQRRGELDKEWQKEINSAKPGSGYMAGLLHELGLSDPSYGIIDQAIDGAKGYGSLIGAAVDWLKDKIRGSGSSSSSAPTSSSYDAYRAGKKGYIQLSSSYDRYRR